VFSLSRKLKLNLNSHLVVIFVLRLVKPLSENTKRNCSAKVKVMQCLMDHLREFHQIDTLVQLGTMMNRLDHEIKRSKAQ